MAVDANAPRLTSGPDADAMACARSAGCTSPDANPSGSCARTDAMRPTASMETLPAEPRTFETVTWATVAYS